MKLLNAGIHLSRLVTKWIAMITMFMMMLIIALSVLLRAFAHPFSGQVEIVELLMLTLIMAGLSYTQSQDGHVDVGLIVDRFPMRIQAMFDLLACVLIIAVSCVISFYNFQGLARYIEAGYTSQILSIPLFPFKIFVAVGLLLWGLEGLLKLIKTVIVLRNGKDPQKQTN